MAEKPRHRCRLPFRMSETCRESSIGYVLHAAAMLTNSSTLPHRVTSMSGLVRETAFPAQGGSFCSLIDCFNELLHIEFWSAHYGIAPYYVLPQEQFEKRC